MNDTLLIEFRFNARLDEEQNALYLSKTDAPIFAKYMEMFKIDLLWRDKIGATEDMFEFSQEDFAKKMFNFLRERK